MTEASRCPECDECNTHHDYTQRIIDQIEERRVCNDCLAEYSNIYDLIDRRVEEPGNE